VVVVTAELERRVEAAQAEVVATLWRLAATRSRLAETRILVSAKRIERQELHDLIYARLHARVQAIPIVEQARGIIMAESGCSPDDALAKLTLASRRGNIGVTELAAQVVARVSAGDPHPPPFADHGFIASAKLS